MFEAGQTRGCLLQIERLETTKNQSLTRAEEEKYQEKLVAMVKQNVRASDRIVPRWDG